VLVLLHNSGRGRRSRVDAAQVTAKVANVLRIRDGRVVELVLYYDRERALADLGLAPD
jgi:ketosteroid isomerase-like protein